MSKRKTPEERAASGQPSPAVVRFGKALRQAMVVNRLSERQMAARLGITSGTTQKYFRGEVDPMRVSTAVNKALAGLLGVTTDQLVAYYESGEFDKEVVGGITFEEVTAWLRSPAGAEHIGTVLEVAAQVCKQGPVQPLQPDEPLPRYTWPVEELEAAGVSAALRKRMGLTDEELRPLIEDGVFDDDLVEAFSVATGLAAEEVRKAFRLRMPIPPEGQE